jgi:hypothetical protein
MIEASQRIMIRINSQVKEGVGINPAMKRHLELGINGLSSSKRILEAARRYSYVPLYHKRYPFPRQVNKFKAILRRHFPFYMSE